MNLWIDAQLSPALARWISAQFEGVNASAVRDLGLREAEDSEIFDSARSAGSVVLTKDSDFVDLVNRRGPPPQVVWLRCGNTSNARMREILSATWPEVLALLRRGEALVEISGS